VVDIGADPGDIIFDSRHTLLGAPTDLIRRKRNADGTTTQVEKVASSNGSTVFECYQYTWPGINENNTVSDCPRIKKFTPCFTPFVFTGFYIKTNKFYLILMRHYLYLQMMARFPILKLFMITAK